MSKTVLITGGTGLIGGPLSDFLAQKGYTIRHLSRKENLNAKYPAYRWDLSKAFIDPKALEGVTHIIHLAGAGIADKRWSAKRKKEIIDSRVKSAELLKHHLEKTATQIKAFVACSAVGFYGDQGQNICTETSQPIDSSAFMVDTCIQWENASTSLRALNIRTPVIRVGIVLSSKGGALSKMLPSYSARIGAYFGNGQQYYAWVHIDDVVRIFAEALENPSMEGVYNATAPTPVTNKELAYKIAEALNKKALIVPAPSFAMRLAMGEMANVVLNSTRATPKALQELNFQFNFEDITAAIRDIVTRKI